MKVAHEVIEVSRITLTLDDILDMIDQKVFATDPYSINDYANHQVSICIDFQDSLKLRFIQNVIKGYEGVQF